MTGVACSDNILLLDKLCVLTYSCRMSSSGSNETVTPKKGNNPGNGTSTIGVTGVTHGTTQDPVVGIPLDDGVLPGTTLSMDDSDDVNLTASARSKRSRGASNLSTTIYEDHKRSRMGPSLTGGVSAHRATIAITPPHEDEQGSVTSSRNEGRISNEREVREGALPTAAAFTAEGNGAASHEGSHVEIRQQNVDYLPYALFIRIPVEERDALIPVMAKKGYQSPNWPMGEFARLYLLKGCHEVLRQYCRMILQTTAVREQFELSQQYAGQPTTTLFDEEWESQRKQQIKQEKERQEMGFRDFEAPWNQAEEGPPRDTDLAAVFNQIDAKKSKEILEGFERYPDCDPDEEKSDYLAWVRRIRSDLNAHSTYNANYALLRKAGHLYSTELLRGHRFNLRTMHTDALIMKLGALVYRQQGKNPLQLACDAKKGRWGCTSRQDLYQRVVDLYYCRSDNISEQDFVISLFVAVSMKIPVTYREAYYKDVFALYPSLNDKMQGNPCAQMVKGLPPAAYQGTGSGLPFPTGPKAIKEFACSLVYKASQRNAQELEQAHTRHCIVSNDPLYGLMQKPKVLDKPRRGDMKANSTPKRDKSTSEKENSAPRRGAKQADRGGAPPATPERGSGLRRPKLWCTHCKRSAHTEETCWELHPELKEEFRRKRTEERRGQAPNQQGTPGRARVQEVVIKPSPVEGEGFQ